jgi:adenosyl cobinamide kinase/adenosyl cobinamide phosphate guanylyltransferase
MRPSEYLQHHVAISVRRKNALHDDYADTVATAIAVAALIISGLSLYVAYLSYQRTAERDQREARLQDPQVVVQLRSHYDAKTWQHEAVVIAENMGPGVIRHVQLGARYQDWDSPAGEPLPALAANASEVRSLAIPRELETQLLEEDSPQLVRRAPLDIEKYLTGWARYTDVHGQTREVTS